MLFTPLDDPKIKLHFKLIEKFCRHLFHYRRKQCQKAIKTLFPESMEDELANEVLRRARVNPRIPCTKISIEEIRDMCHVYYEICHRIPGLFYYDYRNKKVSMEDLVAKELLYPPEYAFVNEFKDTM